MQKSKVHKALRFESMRKNPKAKAEGFFRCKTQKAPGRGLGAKRGRFGERLARSAEKIPDGREALGQELANLANLVVR